MSSVSAPAAWASIGPPSLTFSTIPAYGRSPPPRTRGAPVDLTGKVADRHRQRAGPRPRLRHRTRPPRRRRRRQRRRRRRRRRRPSPPSPRRAARAVAEVVPVGHAARPRRPLVDRAVERVRPARRPGHQRRHPARHDAVEDDRRRLRRRHHHPPARHLHLRPRRRGPHARAGRGRPDHLRRLPGRPASATSARPTTPPPRPASSAWCAPGRWSWPAPSITVNAIVPVAATAMTETIPFLKPYVEALKAGEPLPPFARAASSGFGTPAGRRRRWSPSSPPTPPPASPARPSASAATGWRCGRTRARSSSSSPTARLVGRRHRRRLARRSSPAPSRPSASSSRSPPK